MLCLAGVTVWKDIQLIGVAQLVERYVWDVEAAGSSPATYTKRLSTRTARVGLSKIRFLKADLGVC